MYTVLASCGSSATILPQPRTSISAIFLHVSPASALRYAPSTVPAYTTSGCRASTATENTFTELKNVFFQVVPPSVLLKRPSVGPAAGHAPWQPFQCPA